MYDNANGDVPVAQMFVFENCEQSVQYTIHIHLYSYLQYINITCTPTPAFRSPPFAITYSLYSILCKKIAQRFHQSVEHIIFFKHTYTDTWGAYCTSISLNNKIFSFIIFEILM